MRVARATARLRPSRSYGFIVPGGLGQGGEQRDLRPGQVGERLSEVAPGRVAHAVHVVSVRCEAEVVGQHGVAAVPVHEQHGGEGLDDLAGVRSGAGSCIRATCIASVLAPLIRSPEVRFCCSARPTARGSTPGWEWNRRSSMASVAATTRSGTASMGQ